MPVSLPSRASRRSRTLDPGYRMLSFTITPSGPFALAQSAQFLRHSAVILSQTSGDAEHVHLAFVVDGTEEAVGACLQAEGDRVCCDVYGDADDQTVRRQI